MEYYRLTYTLFIVHRIVVHPVLDHPAVPVQARVHGLAVHLPIHLLQVAIMKELGPREGECFYFVLRL